MTTRDSARTTQAGFTNHNHPYYATHLLNHTAIADTDSAKHYLPQHYNSTSALYRPHDSDLNRTAKKGGKIAAPNPNYPWQFTSTELKAEAISKLRAEDREERHGFDIAGRAG